MGTFISILKAIPIVDKWFQALMVAYSKAMVGRWEKANAEGLRKALNEHDQIDLEKAIGSSTAGLPSGDAGAVIVDAPPPGVPQP
jgi:hypothetical protein